MSPFRSQKCPTILSNRNTNRIRLESKQTLFNHHLYGTSYNIQQPQEHQHVCTDCSNNPKLSTSTDIWWTFLQKNYRVNYHCETDFDQEYLFLGLLTIFFEISPREANPPSASIKSQECLHELPTRDQRGPQPPFHTSLPFRP